VSDDDLDLRATTDRLALRALADRYAAGVDRRDRDLFLSAFHEDGVLVLLDRADPTQVTATRRGHHELGAVTELITRYDKTFHFVGNARYEVDVEHDYASGEVYCVAHHLTTGRHGGTDYVMMIRYLDTYTRRDGRWGIDERRLVTDWTELRTANRI
jgi:hypothetical protein